MSAMRRDIGVAALGEARLWLGTPYRHQASLRGVGCDCLGLLRGVWRGLYGAEPETVPPYAASWAESAPPGTDPLTAAAARHLVPVAGATPGPGDVLLFGPEPTGLPDEALTHPRVTELVRIPMLPGRRSLNLSNAAAVVAYEAWRQQGFPGAQ